MATPPSSSITASPAGPGPETPAVRRPGTFRALRHYNYQLYFFSQIISLTGSWVQAAALTRLALGLPPPSRWPAVVSAAQILPMLLLSLWGGGLADRLSRRLLIFLSQSGLLLLAFFLAALVAFDRVTPLGLL